MTDRANIEAAIAALEAQRHTLGDAVVDLAVAPLRAQLDEQRPQLRAPQAQLDGPRAPLASPSVPSPLPVPSVPLAEGASERRPRLKQVTVLFVDVVGSTSMGRLLDPEDIHEVMNGALERFKAVIERYGGRVLNYTGDGFLAAFGADVASEHDAEGSVRAGLAIIDEAAAVAAELAERRGISGFDVRVGTETGPVLVGGGLEGDGNIRGTAVNLAARMEQTAPVGGLRISHNTYRLVRGLFDVVEQPPIRVKGMAEPVRTYVVQGAKPRAFRVAARGIEGLDTPMVGRDRELAQLQALYRTLCERRRFASVLVAADAGVGKSRLLYEFEDWAEVQPQRYWLFRGRAQAQTATQPYGLLRDLLAWRFEISESDSAEVARRKLVDSAMPLFADDPAAVHLLGHLIGLDFTASPHVRGIVADAQQVRARAFHAGAQLLRRMASLEGDRPILVFLDDLHWADDGTLDFLSYLAREDHDVAMLVVASARPALFERRPHWADDGWTRRIDLAPLASDQANALADVLLQKLEEVPPRLRELLTASVGGNPFFMEELVMMLLDDGAVVATETGSWKVVPDRLQATKVPGTLLGVLQARFDALGDAERIALQQAAVIGFLFWDLALAALDARSPEALEPLGRRGFVVEQPTSALASAREFTFQHHLLHQFLYDSLLKRERSSYHAKAADWLARFADERGAEYLGATGEHHERAGNRGEAIRYYARAAQAAARRDARNVASAYVDKALALSADDDTATRWDLLATRVDLLALADDRAALFAALDALDATAAALDDDHRRTHAALCRTRALGGEGDYPAAEVVGRRALALAERLDAPGLAAQINGQLALAVRRQGRFDEAEAVASAGLALARRGGDRRTEAELLRALGAILKERGRDATDAHARRALDIARELDDRVLEAELVNSIADGCIRIGDYHGARTWLADGRRLSRDLGWTSSEAVIVLNEAAVASLLGDLDTAVRDATQAVELAVAAGARDLEAAAHLPLGLALTGLGRFEQARAALERSRDLFELNGGHHLALEPIAGLAQLALATGDHAAALSAVEDILGHLASGGDLHGTEEPFRIRWTCYEVLAAAGDERAAEVLRSAYTELQHHADDLEDVADRQRFLSAVPHHRAIVEAWRRGPKTTTGG